MLNKRVTFLKRGDSVEGEYSREAGSYEEIRSVWASVDFSKGLKSLREGAYDAYEVIMVRCNYFPDASAECRLKYKGNEYEINSFHADFTENTIQITATMITQ